MKKKNVFSVKPGVSFISFLSLIATCLICLQEPFWQRCQDSSNEDFYFFLNEFKSTVNRFRVSNRWHVLPRPTAAHGSQRRVGIACRDQPASSRGGMDSDDESVEEVVEGLYRCSARCSRGECDEGGL